MILVIDNYDSFTYNLVQYIGELGEEIVVKRNDELSIADIRSMQPNHILLSPGPCTPNEAGVCLDVLAELQGEFPIMGVCLGHQAIGQAFGAKVVRAERLMHGKTSRVLHDGRGLFADVPNPFTAARYHSLIVERATIGGELEIAAETEIGEVMAVRHKRYAIEGVQFHPESIVSEHGHQILRNFLKHTSGMRGVQL